MTSNKHYTGIMGSIVPIEPNAYFLSNFLPGGTSNCRKHDDAKVRDLVTRARATSDEAQLAQLYRDAQKRVTEAGPRACLYLYGT